MTTETIIVLAVGVILIIVSFLLTGKDNEDEEKEEKTTPGLREELTEADKKQLKKLTDTYIREYGKKQVKDTVKNAVDSRIKESVSQKQPAIDEKLSVIDEKLSMIDARSEAGVKAIADEAAAISSGWDENRREVQAVYDSITEKEKEVKLQLNLIDEYKRGLEKLKDEADSSVSRLEELSNTAAERTVTEAAETEAPAEGSVEEEETSAVQEAAEEAEEAAEEAEEAAAEETDEAEETAEEADEAEEAEEEADDAAAEEADEAVAQAEETEEESEEEAAEAEEEDAAGEMTEEADETAAQAEDDPDEEETDRTSGVVLPFVPGDVADKAIEDAARETLRRDSAEDEDELDEFDDEFDEDEDDLKTITNLDQILDREGIDLNAEDPTLNILTMYGAGLSIIEISKVLKMGVGEVKYIIDSNTAN